MNGTGNVTDSRAKSVPSRAAKKLASLKAEKRKIERRAKARAKRS